MRPDKSVRMDPLWLFELPFLPPGRGGLILILGGISMLSLSLTVLLVMPARIPFGAGQASGRIGRMAGLAQRTIDAPIDVHPDSWHAKLQHAARAAGVRNLSFRLADHERCVLVVENCISCRLGRRVCERERRRIERSARRLSRRARVEEVSCRIDGRPFCAFVVLLTR